MIGSEERKQKSDNQKQNCPKSCLHRNRKSRKVSAAENYSTQQTECIYQNVLKNRSKINIRKQPRKVCTRNASNVMLSRNVKINSVLTTSTVPLIITIHMLRTVVLNGTMDAERLWSLLTNESNRCLSGNKQGSLLA